jgi:hypothetical protein
MWTEVQPSTRTKIGANKQKRRMSMTQATARSRLSRGFYCTHLKSLLHNGVTDCVETYTTVLHRISQDPELHRKLQASSLWLQGRRHSEAGGTDLCSKRDGTFCYGVLSR